MNKRLLLIILLLSFVTSCIPIKELKYVQPDGKLELTEDGYIDINKEEYRLQPDDVLLITIISKDPTIRGYFGSALTEGALQAAGENIFYIKGIDVDREGKIDIPTLGQFHVQGLNLDEVKEIVEEELHKIYQEDAIFVKTQLNGITYTIHGEVRGPGSRVVYRNQLDILQAVAMAGDLTLVADRKRVKLIRQYPEGKRIVELDLTKESLMNSEFFYLQPNDHIIVNPKPQKTLGTGTNAVGTILQTATLITTTLSLYLFLDRNL